MKQRHSIMVTLYIFNLIVYGISVLILYAYMIQYFSVLNTEYLTLTMMMENDDGSSSELSYKKKKCYVHSEIWYAGA